MAVWPAMIFVFVDMVVGLAVECLFGLGGGERERECESVWWGRFGGGERERGRCDEEVWGEARPGAVCGRCEEEVEMRVVRLVGSVSFACHEDVYIFI